jgi:hypothetical protein
VIAFLVAVADPARYAAIAKPAIERVREGDSLVIAVGGAPVQHTLNAALDDLSDVPDLEAVVIVHEDVALQDIDTASIVRRTFGDPAVALAGVIGAHGVRGLAWWEGSAMAVGHAGTPHVPGGATAGVALTGCVEALDGIVLCLSPWAVRTLRFDEELAVDFHGYDIDLCFQARYHGRRVEVIKLAAHHEHRPLFTDSDAWVRNALRFQQRWIDHRPITQRRHQALAAAAGQAHEQAG